MLFCGERTEKWDAEKKDLIKAIHFIRTGSVWIAWTMGDDRQCLILVASYNSSSLFAHAVARPAGHYTHHNTPSSGLQMHLSIGSPPRTTGAWGRGCGGLYTRSESPTWQ